MSLTQWGMRAGRECVACFSSTDRPSEYWFYLTFVAASEDTSVHAELKERRNCGHGYVYGFADCPFGS
jgi:hypothetical protein